MLYKSRLFVSISLAVLLLQTISVLPAAVASCPSVTAAINNGITGNYPNQFELAEFQSSANCELTFRDNPNIAALNARIQGNPSNLTSVTDRIPAEPLVVAPYDKAGKYGGVLNFLSNAIEARFVGCLFVAAC